MRLSELSACCRGGGREGLRNADCSSEARTGARIDHEETLPPVKRSKKKRVAAFRKTVMSLFRRLRKRHRFAQSSSMLTAYTGRDLDKFALVTAQIAAKGERLAVQIGNRGSVVTFAARSTRKWIPFLVSLKRKSAPQQQYCNLAPGSTVALDSKLPPESSGEEAISSESGATATGSKDHSSADAKREISETPLDEAHTSRSFSDKNWQWRKLGKTATVVAATVGGFSVGKIAAVGITMTVALTFGMLLNKRHGRNLPEVQSADGSSSQKEQAEMERSSVISTDHPRPQEPNQASQLSAPTVVADSLQSQLTAMADSPPCHPPSMSPPLHTKNFVPLQKQDSSPESSQSISPSSEIDSSVQEVAKGDMKQRHRLRSKLLQKHTRSVVSFTAPNSPLAPVSSDSISCSSRSTPNLKFSHSSAVATLFRPDSPELSSKAWKEKKHRKSVSQDSHKHNSPHPVSIFPRRHELGEKKSCQFGLSLTAIGIFIALAGLLSGHMLALICLVCWWYTVPKLRQLLGEASSNFPVVSDPGQKEESIISDVNGKLDLHSSEYKKRVIIEGLLERNLRSTF